MSYRSMVWVPILALTPYWSGDCAVEMELKADPQTTVRDPVASSAKMIPGKIEKEKSTSVSAAVQDLLLEDLFIGPRVKPLASLPQTKVAGPEKAPIKAPPPPPNRPAEKAPPKSTASSRSSSGGSGSVILGLDPAKGGATFDGQKGYYVSRANEPSLVGPPQVFVLSLPIGLPTLSITSVPGFTVTSDASIEWRVIGVPMPGFGPGNLILPSTQTPTTPNSNP